MDPVMTGFYTRADRELARRVAIVGVGESDYAKDYQASRQRDPGYVPPDSESLARTSFDRALADSGLRRQDVNGLGLCCLDGQQDVLAMASALEIEPKLARVEPIFPMYDVVPAAVEAIVNQECDTMALVYAAPSRAFGMTYGGSRWGAGASPTSYHYYHPWGWSSQAAHWAFIFQYYQNEYGVTEEDLGSVAMTLRRHAGRNPNAIMRQPMTIDDYMNSRYIVTPLRLFDMCLVNDGSVCLILRRTDMSKGLSHVPVEVAGWAHAKLSTPSDKMHNMVRERLRPQFEAAKELVFAMAEMDASAVGHFQGYDASSIHLIDQLEGFGFVPPGQGLEFCKAGEMDIGGTLPVNTSGGMLSEAYMHGWNHVAEAVRQLRHEAGEGQVADLRASLFSLADTDSVHPLLLVRGER